MDKLFLLKFAYKNLRIHKFRMILTFVGIAIGIAAILFLISFAFGIEKIVTSEITTGNAYKLVDIGTGDLQSIKINKNTINKIKAIKGVSLVEPVISIGAKAKISNSVADVTFNGSSNL